MTESHVQTVLRKQRSAQFRQRVRLRKELEAANKRLQAAQIRFNARREEVEAIKKAIQRLDAALKLEPEESQ